MLDVYILDSQKFTTVAMENVLGITCPVGKIQPMTSFQQYSGCTNCIHVDDFFFFFCWDDLRLTPTLTLEDIFYVCLCFVFSLCVLYQLVFCVYYF